MDLLDLKDYGYKNNYGCRFSLVLVDEFGNFGETIFSKRKCFRTLKVTFEKVTTSKETKLN